ncbi:hypothetical protein ACROYT_G001396 [Oculina patagonica]
MRNACDPRSRYACWLVESEEFNFVIQHRPGASNLHADPLSRMPTVHSLFCDGQLSLLEFQNCQQSDPVLGIPINDLQRDKKNENNPAVHGWSGKRDFLTLGKEDGLLYLRYKVGKRHVYQLVVPAVLIPAILSLKHDNAGHMGPEKTTNLIRQRLQPTHGENLTGPPTVVPSTVSPALSVSMPPPSSQVKDNANPEDAASALHQSGQLEDSVTREDTPSRDTQTRALLCPLTDIAAPSVPTAQGSVPNLCRPPQGLGTEPFG